MRHWRETKPDIPIFLYSVCVSIPIIIIHTQNKQLNLCVCVFTNCPKNLTKLTFISMLFHSKPHSLKFTTTVFKCVKCQRFSENWTKLEGYLNGGLMDVRKTTNTCRHSATTCLSRFATVTNLWRCYFLIMLSCQIQHKKWYEFTL